MQNPTLQVETVDDARAFAGLRDEWNGLLAASPANRLFLTWEWLYTWWKHLSGSRRLHLLTVRREGEIVAIAPLAESADTRTVLLPFRMLEFLGTGSVGSDYLDIIVRSGQEEAVRRALGDHLARERLLLELASVQRSSCFAAALAAELCGRGWRRSEQPFETCPFVDLSRHSWESYLATLGGKHCRNLRRRIRNLTAAFDLRFECVGSEEDRREALAAFLGLHHLRWQNRGGSNALDTPALQSFHDEVSRLALERGWLRLFLLRLDGRAAAALYGFLYNGTFYYYQQGFDPAHSTRGLGLVMTGLTIERAMQEGASEYDFLRGAEEYKFFWAPQTRELTRLQLYPPTLAGRIHEQALHWTGTARRTARKVLPRPVAERLAAVRDGRLWSRRHG